MPSRFLLLDRDVRGNLEIDNNGVSLCKDLLCHMLWVLKVLNLTYVFNIPVWTLLLCVTLKGQLNEPFYSKEIYLVTSLFRSATFCTRQGQDWFSSEKMSLCQRLFTQKCTLSAFKMTLPVSVFLKAKLR